MDINDANKYLKNYIETNIFPMYERNDEGHNIKHILSVIERSFELAPNNIMLNPDIIYTAASFHDVGASINRERHHIESAKILMNDEYMSNYFNEYDLQLTKEAIEDHRASLKGIPRNIYGKILSSADRPINLDEFILRAYNAAKKNRCLKNDGIKSDHELTHEELIEAVYVHLIDKFGNHGYSKIYFIDSKYNEFLKDAKNLTDNKEEYLKRVKNLF